MNIDFKEIGITLLIVIVALIIYNQVVQPMLNSKSDDKNLTTGTDTGK